MRLLLFALLGLSLGLAAPPTTQYNPSPTATTPPAHTCGIAKSPRIIGGAVAQPGEFPWLVSILLNGNHYCGGALIKRRWVLTAAHCINRHKRTSLKIRVGEHKLSERTRGEREVSVERIVLHPNFVLAKYVNDLALLRLAEDLSWDHTRQPICLPGAESDSVAGREMQIAGWGWLNEPERGGSRANVLQKLEVRVVEKKECQSWYHQAGKFITINANHMCAGFKDGGKDSCQGDSGGPLMWKDGNGFRIVGVVSAGIGCGRPLLPGLYTKVFPFLSWINNNTLT